MSALAIVLGAALAAAPGGARRLAVVPVVLAEPNAEVSEVSVLAEVGEVLRYRGKLQPIPLEELLTSAEGFRGCGADTMCLTERLGTADVSLGLVVLVNAKLAPAFVSVQLLDVLERRTVAQSRGPAAESVSTDLRARVARVLRDAGYEESGRLIVDAVPSGSEVTISPPATPEPNLRDTFIVPPGPYTITVSHEGYASTERHEVVEIGRDTRVSVVLEANESVLRSPWLWVALIAAATAGATTAILLASRGDPRICITADPIPCDR